MHIKKRHTKILFQNVKHSKVFFLHKHANIHTLQKKKNLNTTN